MKDFALAADFRVHNHQKSRLGQLDRGDEIYAVEDRHLGGLCDSGRGRVDLRYKFNGTHPVARYNAEMLGT